MKSRSVISLPLGATFLTLLTTLIGCGEDDEGSGVGGISTTSTGIITID